MNKHSNIYSNTKNELFVLTSPTEEEVVCRSPLGEVASESDTFRTGINIGGAYYARVPTTWCCCSANTRRDLPLTSVISPYNFGTRKVRRTPGMNRGQRWRRSWIASRSKALTSTAKLPSSFSKRPPRNAVVIFRERKKARGVSKKRPSERKAHRLINKAECARRNAEPVRLQQHDRSQA